MQSDGSEPDAANFSAMKEMYEIILLIYLDTLYTLRISCCK